jgi:hypothetical protein
MADLVLSSACARSHKRIRAQIALDVGGDDFSSDAITRHEPLVCARHGKCRLERRGDGMKDGTDVSTGMGQETRTRRNRRKQQCQDGSGERGWADTGSCSARADASGSRKDSRRQQAGQMAGLNQYTGT